MRQVASPYSVWVQTRDGSISQNNEIRFSVGDNRHLLMTGAVLAMLPVAALFVIFQRHIMAGVATTGIKS